ncbi:MAG: TonB family protein [Pseudomonadales bacterium]|nr:TonB family protein [Pseudomonadales bacterium]
MTEVVHIDARWIVQLVLCSALLSAFAIVAFRSNPITRRAYTLMAGLVLTTLPFALALTSGWHWTAPFEVLKLMSLAGSVPIPVWLIVVWTVGALALNLRGLFRLVETRRELAALPTVDDPLIVAEAALVARRLAFDRPYHLHFGPSSCSSALAGNRIVLRSDAKDWDPRAVQAVLAHEFVHLARRDDLCLFGLGLVLNWYWFAPWVSLLRAQYASAMEQSCDDRAAEILPSCADYLDGVLCAARSEQEPSIVAALAGSGVVTRFQRFLGNRERQLDAGGVYWGLVVGLGVALLFTSVEFEAHEAAPVRSLAGYSGLRTLTFEPELDLPEVSERALGGDRAVKHAPSPIYPGRAISDGIEGHVVVEYTVSRDGRVVRPAVVDSEPPGVFDEVALRAVARREYVPSHELENAGSRNPPSRILRRFDFDLPDTEPETTTLAPLAPPPNLPPPNLPQPGVELPEPDEDWVAPAPMVSIRVDSSVAKPSIEPRTFQPIVKVAPIYPRHALERNLEGHVLLEFAVTTAGAVRDPVVLEADPPGVFDDAAISAASRFIYKPAVVQGEPVEVTGVRNRIVFEFSDG